jgi:hypothetical protein
MPNTPTEIAREMIARIEAVENAPVMRADKASAMEDDCRAFIDEYAYTLARALLAAQEEVERLRSALPPAEKLRLLADWFENVLPKMVFRDGHEHKHTGDQVQHDIRKWADSIDAAMAAESEAGK